MNRFSVNPKAYTDTIIAGFLSKEPEEFADGKVVVLTFPIQRKWNYTDKEGNEQKGETKVFWAEAKAFNEFGQQLKNNLQKGDLVVCKVDPQKDSWEKEGVTYYKTSFIIRSVELKYRKDADMEALAKQINGKTLSEEDLSGAL